MYLVAILPTLVVSRTALAPNAEILLDPVFGSLSRVFGILQNLSCPFPVVPHCRPYSIHLLHLMIPSRAILLSAGASVASKHLGTVFIEETVVIVLFEGVVVAQCVAIASLHAVLEVRYLEGVHPVALALVRAVALSCRTAGEKYL